MALQLPPKPGLSNPVVRNVPDQWDAQWFRRFITDYLKFADARNAISPDNSVTIAGTLTGPAQLSVAFGAVPAAGVWEPPFQSGSIQFNNNGVLGGVGDFQWGFALPNASGIPSEGILVGGAGKTQVIYITDEQIPGLKGITVIREAGDASAFAPATDAGGDLLDFAGASLNGDGGTSKYQGGTSVHARAGDSILHGGN